MIKREREREREKEKRRREAEEDLRLIFGAGGNWMSAWRHEALGPEGFSGRGEAGFPLATGRPDTPPCVSKAYFFRTPFVTRGPKQD